MDYDMYFETGTAPSLREKMRPRTSEQLVAEGLHSVLCWWNHTDGCSWLYGTWDDLRHPREKYLRKAHALLEAVNNNEEMAHAVIAALKTK